MPSSVSSLLLSGGISRTVLCDGTEVIRSMAKGLMQQMAASFETLLRPFYDSLHDENSKAPSRFLSLRDDRDITNKVAFRQSFCEFWSMVLSAFGEAADLYNRNHKIVIMEFCHLHRQMQEHLEPQRAFFAAPPSGGRGSRDN